MGYQQMQAGSDEWAFVEGTPTDPASQPRTKIRSHTSFLREPPMSRKSKSTVVEAAASEEPAAPDEGATVSNAQAVRNALSAGHDDIDAIDKFVREQYGKDIPRQQISAYKSQTRRKAGEPTRRGRRSIDGYLAPPRISPEGDADLIEALRALKPLVAKVGVENVKKLAELLS